MLGKDGQIGTEALNPRPPGGPEVLAGLTDLPVTGPTLLVAMHAHEVSGVSPAAAACATEAARGAGRMPWENTSRDIRLVLRDRFPNHLIPAGSLSDIG